MDQLFYPARNQASTRRVGELRFLCGRLRGDGAPESEPRKRVSQGFYGLPLPGPCLASWTGGTSGKVVDVETNLEKQMCVCVAGGAVGWTLLSHHGGGLSFLHFYWDVFSYTILKGKLSQTSASQMFMPT